MTEQMCFDAVNEAIGEVATDVAQAYAEFGDLTSMFLGQTSSTLQLRLFRPLALEISLYMSFLLQRVNSSMAAQILQETEEYATEMGNEPSTFVKERLAAYQNSSDDLLVFTTLCQKVVGDDELWLSMQRKDAKPQVSISDKGFVAIQKGALRLNQLVSLL